MLASRASSTVWIQRWTPSSTRQVSLPFFQCLQTFKNVVQTHDFDSDIEKILKYKSHESGGFVLQWISCSGF